jgi:hypothetical protein
MMRNYAERQQMGTETLTAAKARYEALTAKK